MGIGRSTFVLITERGREREKERERERQYSQYLVAGSLGFWLIYNCCVINVKERTERAEPLSSLLSPPLTACLSVKLISSLCLIFVSFTSALSPPPALSVSLYLSLNLVF